MKPYILHLGENENFRDISIDLIELTLLCTRLCSVIHPFISLSVLESSTASFIASFQNVRASAFLSVFSTLSFHYGHPVATYISFLSFISLILPILQCVLEGSFYAECNKSS